MFKKITLVTVVLISAITTSYSQAAWEFVGPKSNNNASGAEFETAQMTKVLTNPGAPNKVFATSKFAGLWMSVDNGDNWTNIDMAPTGLDQALAIGNKNANEILVGNFIEREDLNNTFTNTPNSYSSRVSAYNFNTNTWIHYPPLPTPSGKFTIKSVAVHPDNQNIIYAGTTKGLYRYNGSSWDLIVPNCNIETVLFAENLTSEVLCYVSGSDQPEGSTTPGKAMILTSTDSGNSVFNSFVSTFNSDVNIHPKSHSQICVGPGGIFVLTVCTGTTLLNNAPKAAEPRYIHRIVKSGSVYTSIKLTDWIDNAHLGWSWNSYSGNDPLSSSTDRMAIAYNSILNAIFIGAVNASIHLLDASYLNVISGGINTGNKMTAGKIHADIHDFHTNGLNTWVACDGGIGLSIVQYASQYSPPTLGPFNRKNNKLDVSLIYGFSGSEVNKDIYAFGGHDITNNDIYDASQGKNKYTHIGQENDGALIYKFDEKIVIMDDYINYPNYRVSLDGGLSLSAPYGPYNPYPSPPFTADISSFANGPVIGGSKRIIQDPYRSGRVYRIGGKEDPDIYQYDFNQNKMVYKVGFKVSTPSLNTNLNPITSKVNPYQIIQDISFSAQTKNSLYVLTSNSWQNMPSAIIRYIGPDLDDCWKGHNEYFSGTQAQWAEITPDYANLGTILGGGAANIAAADMGRVSLKKIETSITNLDLIYVAGNFDYNAPNNAIKVLRFDGFTWTNYSAGIPADAIVCTMVMDHYSNDALYLGTDQGVFYRDASLGYWEPYYAGQLPKQKITQMEINYKENTVRASTFGRGIFKSPLKCPNFVDLNIWNANPAGYYEGKKITHSSTQVTSQTATMLRAKEDITLLPGMFVAPSISKTYFEALIHDCYGGSSSPYLFRESSEPIAESKLEEKNIKDFDLFPNPNNGLFTLQFVQTGKKEIEIKDLLGRTVREFKTEGSDIQLNLSDLKKGVYLVKVKAENKEMIKKVIID